MQADPPFSFPTLALFRQLLDQVTLQAGAPDFEEGAMAVIAARKELEAVLAQTGPPKP